MRKILIVVAHPGDFVWRAGGIIAKCIENGDDVKIIVLSLGHRGESNSYWFDHHNSSIKECQLIRKRECLSAATVLGVKNIVIMNHNDYPIKLNKKDIKFISSIIYNYKPHCIITHSNKTEYFNPDHGRVGEAVENACCLIQKISAMPIYELEPHDCEMNNFIPKIYIDISGVIGKKIKAMKSLNTQIELFDYYINKAKIRGYQAKFCGDKSILFAETLYSKSPIIIKSGL